MDPSVCTVDTNTTNICTTNIWLVLLVISIIITTIGLIYTYTRKNKDRRLREPNDNKAPGSLDMLRYLFIFTIGPTMVGSFKYRNGVNISYHCYSISIGNTIILPIIPLGCYDCEDFTNISGDCQHGALVDHNPGYLEKFFLFTHDGSGLSVVLH